MLEDWRLTQKLKRTDGTPAADSVMRLRNTCNTLRSMHPSLPMLIRLVGMCICDSDDYFVLAKITWFSPLCSVDVDEVLGIYRTLQRAAKLGMNFLLI